MTNRNKIGLGFSFQDIVNQNNMLSNLNKL